MIVWRRTTACTTADSAKPRTSAHRISQVIDPAMRSAWPIAFIHAPQVLIHLTATYTPTGYGCQQGRLTRAGAGTQAEPRPGRARPPARPPWPRRSASGHSGAAGPGGV